MLEIVPYPGWVPWVDRTTLPGIMEGVEMAAVYYEVIIDTEVVLDTPKVLKHVFQAGFLVWETVQDDLFKYLIFPVFSSMSPDFV